MAFVNDYLPDDVLHGIEGMVLESFAEAGESADGVPDAP